MASVCRRFSNGRDIAQLAIDDLQRAGAIVGVEHALVQLGNGTVVAVSNCQAGSVVAALVDSIAGGELLNGLALESVVNAEVLLRYEGVDVSLNGNDVF